MSEQMDKCDATRVYIVVLVEVLISSWYWRWYQHEMQHDQHHHDCSYQFTHLVPYGHLHGLYTATGQQMISGASPHLTSPQWTTYTDKIFQRIDIANNCARCSFASSGHTNENTTSHMKWWHEWHDNVLWSSPNSRHVTSADGWQANTWSSPNWAKLAQLDIFIETYRRD